VRVIAGNPGRGVYMADAVGVDVCVSIMGVPSLAAVSFDASHGLTVSACVTLTQLRAALEAQATQPGAGHARRAHRCATRPRRPALMRCHKQPDFPSDVVTIMTAAGARVTVGSAQGQAV
jgi:hypothetical protein